MGQTKISGCLIRIKRKRQQIADYKKYRGNSAGTFWQDLPAVDAAILELEKELKELQKELQRLYYARRKENMSPNEQEDQRSVARNDATLTDDGKNQFPMPRIVEGL